MGNFPAAALMYRLGHIRQGSSVVHEERSLENLWQRNAPAIAEGQSFDPNRDKIAFAEGSPVKTVVDPLAVLGTAAQRVGATLVPRGGGAGLVAFHALGLSPFEPQMWDMGTKMFVAAGAEPNGFSFEVATESRPQLLVELQARLGRQRVLSAGLRAGTRPRSRGSPAR